MTPASPSSAPTASAVPVALQARALHAQLFEAHEAALIGGLVVKLAVGHERRELLPHAARVQQLAYRRLHLLQQVDGLVDGHKNVAFGEIDAVHQAT